MTYTTIADLVDATFRLWLEPPDFQPPIAVLRQDMDDSTDEMKLGDFALPEDEQLLRVGVVLEAGSELMRVMEYNATTLTATVRRGELGTARAGHAQPAPVKLSPPYPRIDVVAAVIDNVATLSPALFTVNVIPVSEAEPGVAVMPDPLAIGVIEITRDSHRFAEARGARIVDHHPQTGTRSVLLPPGLGQVWVRYRRRVGLATGEADLLTDLHMEPLWAPAVIAGAAGDIMVGKDIGRSHAEWVGQILESEGVKYGSRQTIGFGLIQFRQLKVESFSDEMGQEYPDYVVEQNDPFFIVEGG